VRVLSTGPYISASASLRPTDKKRGGKEKKRFGTYFRTARRSTAPPLTTLPTTTRSGDRIGRGGGGKEKKKATVSRPAALIVLSGDGPNDLLFSSRSCVTGEKGGRKEGKREKETGTNIEATLVRSVALGSVNVNFPISTRS